MNKYFAATVSAFALLATPVLAQSQSTPKSDSETKSQSQDTSQSKSQSQSQSQGSPAQMLGKQVRLKGSKEAVGEITDVVVVNGKVEDVVVEMKDEKDAPVMVSITEFGPPLNDTYILSMTEAELKASPPYEGKSDSQKSGAKNTGSGSADGSTGSKSGSGGSSR